ncbi:hypothetical protein CPB85DRAFT_1256412 [Mucidula mucida]|nr:hypothetical protein CPB85DRAFT_1256412 [Mucidula mucida]
MSRQQQSLFVEEKQGPFVVLVKIIAAGLNPVDWKIQKSGLLVEKYPAVLGLDSAGEIEAVGEDVEGWIKGDKVICQSMGGTYQQYMTISAKVVMRLPQNLSFAQGVTVPIVSSQRVSVSWGKRLLRGLSYEVTLFPAIRILKAIGFARIIVYASARHFAFLQTLDATDLIDRAQTPVTPVPSVVKALPTSPLTAVYDTIGDAACQQAASECLPPGGTFITVVPENVTQEEGKHVIFVLGSLSAPLQAEFGQIIVSNVTGLFEEGVILPNRFEVLPGGLNAVAEGLERSFKGRLYVLIDWKHRYATTPTIAVAQRLEELLRNSSSRDIFFAINDQKLLRLTPSVKCSPS